MKWIPSPIYVSLPFVYMILGAACYLFRPSSSSEVFYTFSGMLFVVVGLIVIWWRWAKPSLLSILGRVYSIISTSRKPIA
jgi:hypothetical protein